MRAESTTVYFETQTRSSSNIPSSSSRQGSELVENDVSRCRIITDPPPCAPAESPRICAPCSSVVLRRDILKEAFPPDPPPSPPTSSLANARPFCCSRSSCRSATSSIARARCRKTPPGEGVIESVAEGLRAPPPPPALPPPPLPPLVHAAVLTFSPRPSTATLPRACGGETLHIKG